MGNSTNTSADSMISDAKLQECFLYKFVLDAVFDGAMVVVGIIGNILTCIVVSTYPQNSAMPLLMMNLAITDTLVLVVWFSQMATPAICNFLGCCAAYHRLKVILWRYFLPLASTLHLMSTWSVVAIAFTRFVSVCWPSRTPQLVRRARVRNGLAAMQLSCLAFSVVRFAEGYVTRDDGGGLVFVINAMGRSQIYEYLYLVALFYLVSYVVPLSLLSYFTVRLYLALRDLRKKREQMTTKSKETNEMTFWLVVVVVVFMLCQVATPVRRLLSILYEKMEMDSGTPHFYFSSFSVLSISFNSACNFFIFCLFVGGFRRRLIRICDCSIGRVHPTGSRNGNTP